MEEAQREILGVILSRLCKSGLLSESTYLRAVDLVHSSGDFPAFFRYPICTERGRGDEYTQDTQ